MGGAVGLSSRQESVCQRHCGAYLSPTYEWVSSDIDPPIDTLVVEENVSDDKANEKLNARQKGFKVDCALLRCSAFFFPFFFGLEFLRNFFFSPIFILQAESQVK